MQVARVAITAEAGAVRLELRRFSQRGAGEVRQGQVVEEDLVDLVLAGQAPVEGLGSRLGNESLDTGRENCTPIHSRPLPLREIMDELYKKMEAEVDRDRR